MPADPAIQRMGPSRRLVLSGALLGMMPATALVLLGWLGHPFADFELLPGMIVIALVLVSPYVIALHALMLERPTAQAPLLLAATVDSFLASFSALSGVTLILLPSTIVLGIATARCFQASTANLAQKAVVSFGGLVASAFIAASFLALFLWDDARVYRAYSTSDIITPLEALIGLGLLSAGLLVLAGASRYSRRTVPKDIA